MQRNSANFGRELSQMIDDLGFQSVAWTHETGSTNADLMAAARAGASSAVLLAESQTAGRGRRDRTWETPSGANILLSVLTRTTLTPDELGSVLVCLAVATVDECVALGVADVALKWPNDVTRLSGKVGGLLAESVDVDGELLVVAGLGLNVGWPRAGQGPPGASSIGETDRVALAAGIVRAFRSALDEVERNGSGALHARFVASCATIGQRVSISKDAQDPDDVSVVTGVAVGVDELFRLLVIADGASTAVAHAVGDVIHLRAAAEGPR